MRDVLESTELESFIDNHDVIYIRHNMDSTPEVYQRLISGGLIAVHYGGDLKETVDPRILENHEDPENYEKPGRDVIRRLKDYCTKGAVVFAEYSDSDYTPVPKANVGILCGSEGEYSYGAKRYYGHGDYPSGFVYKQAELCNYRTLSYADFEQILAIHPRGGTVIHWQKGETAVKFMYRRVLGLPIDSRLLDVGALFPAQQEVLCSEYLRLKAPRKMRLKYMLLPVGRGMRAIDIDGVTEEAHLFAQVSFSKSETEIREKIRDLQDLAKGYESSKSVELAYFGPKEKEKLVNQSGPNIEFISLEEVFDAMKDTGLLNDMLGIEFV